MTAREAHIGGIDSMQSDWSILEAELFPCSDITLSSTYVFAEDTAGGVDNLPLQVNPFASASMENVIATARWQSSQTELSVPESASSGGWARVTSSR